ncbi:hypothetical protein RTBOTA2_001038 [Rhodotorula toruloides]|uniref:Uncharacterized protein n=1 Tax=Rhodotorula toruloides TaxID=5286 RepID=A0A0K3C8C4_RHOTO|nr:hypothetical protein RTBOTA2_001038 [Rhodotorula toruloides]PRQ77979.1 hypothetical protein AAT19DRAFT_9047 [Rhodotorula toruloides]
MASQWSSPAPNKSKRSEAAVLRKAGGRASFKPGVGGGYADKPTVGTGWGGGVLPTTKPAHDPSEVIVADDTVDGSHKAKFQLDPRRMLKDVHKQMAMGGTTGAITVNSGWGMPIPPSKANCFVSSAPPPPPPPAAAAPTSPSTSPNAGSSFADKVKAKPPSPSTSTSPRMPVTALPTTSTDPQTVRMDLSKASPPVPRQPPASSGSAWADYKPDEPADTVHRIDKWAQGNSEFAAKNKFCAPPAKLPGYAGASPNPAHFPDQTPDVLKRGKTVFNPLEGRWERGRSRTGEVAGRARAQWGVPKEAEAAPPKNETHLSKWATPATNGPTATSREEAPTPTPSSSNASDATVRPSQPNGVVPRPPPQLAPSIPSTSASAARAQPSPSPAPPATSRPAPSPASSVAPAASTSQPPALSKAKVPAEAEVKEEGGKEVEKPQADAATDEVGKMMESLSLTIKEQERVRTPRTPRSPRPGSPFLSAADQARLASGGVKREKKSPEEIDRLMAAMRLKNKEAEKKAEAAKKDREMFESSAAATAEKATAEVRAQRPAHLRQLMDRIRTEMSAEDDEQRQKREKDEAIQRTINEERARTAAAKLSRASSRAWDAGKMSSAPGTPPPATSYPSVEAAARQARREAEERARGPERPVSEAEAERIRKRDGVLNDEVGWESVVHHEGAGRAQTAFSGAGKA